MPPDKSCKSELRADVSFYLFVAATRAGLLRLDISAVRGAIDVLDESKAKCVSARALMGMVEHSPLFAEADQAKLQAVISCAEATLLVSSTTLGEPARKLIQGEIRNIRSCKRFSDGREQATKEKDALRPCFYDWVYRKLTAKS